MSQKIKTIFIGTPDFAISGLESLIADSNFTVETVVTQPDKKRGRQQKLNESAVKKIAKQYKITVLQPRKIKEIFTKIKQINPDIIVVIAYGQIIPQNILDLPKYGCINVHASLLPKYRGASCIQASLLNQDKETGITIMKMDANLDTGPIIQQIKLPIKNNDTAGSLFVKLAKIIKKNLAKILFSYIQGDLTEKKQDDSLSSYVPMIKKKDGHLNWQDNLNKISARFRAMSPWPGVYGVIDSKIIKIIELGKDIITTKHQAGTLFVKNNKLFIQAGDNAVEIKKLQLSGKKIINTDDFIHGYSQFIGKKLT